MEGNSANGLLTEEITYGEKEKRGRNSKNRDSKE